MDKPDLGGESLSLHEGAMWFVQDLAPDSSAYNIPLGYRLRGRLRIEALQRALDLLLDRYPLLASSCPEVRGDIRRVPATRPVVRHESVHGLGPETLRQRMVAEVRRPFDLRRDAPLRVHVFELSEDEQALLIVVHHIAADIRSLEIFERELSGLYLGLIGEVDIELAAPGHSYATYVKRQREYLESDRARELTEARVAALHGCPAAVPLPTDFPDPPSPARRGATIDFPLGGTLTSGLKEVARRAGTTIYRVLMAAFQVLLYRYSGERDFCVGSPALDRYVGEFSASVGLFVNTVAVRAQINPEEPFLDHLGRVALRVTSALEARSIPHVAVVAACGAVDGTRNPLYNVMLSYSSGGADMVAPVESHIGLWGLDAYRVPLPNNEGLVDLFAEFYDLGECIYAALKYDVELFSRETIARMCENLRTLLGSIVRHPEEAVGRLVVIADVERRTLLESWNGTAAEFPTERCVHELFEEQVARTPGALAVISDGVRLSYADLASRARQLARHLRGRGVGPGALVAIALERSVEVIVAILGVLESGAAYVPVDPEYPPDRISYMLKDAAAAVVITQSHLLGRLPASEALVLCIDRDWGMIVAESMEPLTLEATAENLVYVIYTSGSSGAPKGVEITHRAAINLLYAFNSLFPLAEGETFLAVTSLSFDIHGTEIFQPLVRGATVDMVPGPVTRDAWSLREYMQAGGARVMQGTPTLLRMLIDAEWGGAGISRLVCGGESLSLDLAKQLCARVSEVWNLYGPTEATIWASAWRVEPGLDRVYIGKPLANTRMYVLDEQRQPVPLGAPGELYIGGAQLARGYLGRPALTDVRFVPDRISGTPDARLYRTGDLVRWRGVGELEYLGRLDDQVKVRGHRVELGEIEACLEAHELVRHCVVMARETEFGDQELVAFLVADANGGCEAVALRRHLRETLPDYMVPSAFVALDELPRTPNGKIDRKALATKTTSEIGGRKIAPVAPRDDVEAMIAVVWAGVLGLSEIGVDDDFFALGGHSLRAMQVVARLRESMGIRVRVRDLFAHPTITTLAAHARTMRQEEDLRRGVPLQGKEETERGGRDDPAEAPGVAFAFGSDELESLIASVWSAVLGRQVLDIGDDFFDLGGDSLRAARIVAWLRKELMVNLRGVDIFANPTVARLSAFVRSLAKTSQARLIEPSVEGPRALMRAQGAEARVESRYPASFGQESLWVIGQIQRRKAYVVSMGFRLRGHLDVDALSRSLSDLIERHVSLRTRLRLVEGRLVQEVRAAEPVGLEIERAPRGTVTDIEAWLAFMSERAANAELDLEAGRLTWHRLLRLSDDEHVFLWSVHHAAADGWSLEVMVRELRALYTSRIGGSGSGLSAVMPQYTDVGSWQRSWPHTWWEAERAWWRSYLADVPASLDLPTDWPRPAESRMIGATVEIAVEGSLRDALRALGRGCGATLSMIVLAAFAALLYQISGQSSLVLGMTYAGRDLTDLEGVVGTLVNTLPLRVDVDLEVSFISLLGDVLREALEVQEHGHVPFSELVKLSQSRRGGRNPLVQVLVSPQLSAFDGLALPGVEVEAFAVNPSWAGFDLTLSFWETKSGIEARLIYDAELFQRSSAERMSAQLLALLHAVAGASEQPLHKLLSPPQTRYGRSPCVRLDLEETRALRELARARSVTIGHVIGAAWAVLLRRYTRQDTLVIEDPFSEGSSHGQDPWVLELADARFFTDILERVRMYLCGPDASTIRLQWERAEPAMARLESGASLSLRIEAASEGLTGTLDFDASHWSAVDAERIGRQMETLLRHVAVEPSIAVADLSMNDSAALMRWRARSMGPRCDYALDRTVDTVIARMAATGPGHPALRWEGGELTRGELRSQVLRVAGILGAMGIRAGDRVVVHIPLGPEVVVALLAIWELGAVYVPIDPVNPRERVLWMMGAVRAQLVLTADGLAEPVGALSPPMVTWERLLAGVSREYEQPERSLDPSAVAYIIFTSGSTGRPKPVSVQHQGLSNLVHGSRHVVPGYRRDSIAAVKSSISFDMSIWEIVLPLAAGGCLAMIGYEVARNPSRLATSLDTLGVTAMLATDSTWQSLRRVGWVPPPCMNAMTGGEVASEVVATWLRSAGVPVQNLYGPAEATIVALATPTVFGECPQAIGSPLPNTNAWVVDIDGQPAIEGIPGELYLGGVQVSAGYMGMDEETLTRFVPDHFADEPGARMYRTGDLVVWTRDHGLVFLGRVDEQVKIRGYRVEPGEVAVHLDRHPAIAAVCVDARPMHGTLGLVAYVRAEGPVDGEELRAYLAERVPPYMIPAAFVKLDEFPTTRNGKLDRARLPAPGPDNRLGRGRPLEAPIDAMEALIADVWAQLLGVPGVGRGDNFFDLGGHSMLAIEACDELQRRLEREIRTVDLFTYPTVNALARHLQGTRGDGRRRPGHESGTRGARIRAARSRSPKGLL